MERLFNLGLSNALAATVMAIGVAAVSRLCSNRPATLHCLWLLVLLKLVTPPLFEVPIVGSDSEPASIEPVEVSIVKPVALIGPEAAGTSTEPTESELLVLDAAS